MRICSLFPAATEMVCFLGLGENLVGVSHECDWPLEMRGKPVITESMLLDTAAQSDEIDRLVREALADGKGIYRLNEALLRELSPDLILTQDLCLVCAVPAGEVRRVAETLPESSQVLALDVFILEDVFAAMERLAQAAGIRAAASPLLEGLRERVRKVSSLAARCESRPRALCLEWLDPPMSAGHWIPELVQLAGGEKGLGQAGQPSQRITWEEILAYDPEVLLLVPCGFKSERTLSELGRVRWPQLWLEIQAVRQGRVYVADANSYFSRPGPRLVDTLEILAALLHPELFTLKVPPGSVVPVSPEAVGALGETRQEDSDPSAMAAAHALNLYLRDTLGSVFRNMNSFCPGRRKPVKRTDVETYARMYLDIRRLFLDS